MNKSATISFGPIGTFYNTETNETFVDGFRAVMKILTNADDDICVVNMQMGVNNDDYPDDAGYSLFANWVTPGENGAPDLFGNGKPFVSISWRNR